MGGRAGPAVGPAGSRSTSTTCRRRRPRRPARADVRPRPAAAAAASAGVGPRRGADVEAELTLDFADAAHGITTTLHLTSDAQCSTCHGSGAKPGTTPKLCPQCGGRGVIDDNQGLFSFSSPCRRCARRRHASSRTRARRATAAGVETPRPRGAGAHPRRRADGQTIRLKGRGASGRNGGPAGDLLVEIHVAPHAHFGRNGNDLTVARAGHFAEAALGADVDVPTLDGPPSRCASRPGTQPGSRHRVKGKGIATRRRRRAHHRRPDRHRRRRRADAPDRGAERQPSRQLAGGHYRWRHRGVSGVSDATSNSRRLRHLGRRRAGRHASPDAAHLRAPRAGQPGPHPGRQPPLQRRRHRGAAAHRRAGRRRG